MDLVTFDTFKHLPSRQNTVELSDEQLHRLQDVLYNALVDIDKVCRGNGIEYWLCGGSVLGAVRHQGFIPWDDDVDLYMTRAAFERFERVFDAELGSRYVLLTPQREAGFVIAVPQVRMRGTYVRLRDDFELPDERCGACVDIFILDNAPNNRVLRTVHGAVSLGLGLVTSCVKFWKYRRWFMELAGDDRAMRRTFGIKAAIGFLFSWRSPNAWARSWDAWNGLSRNNESDLLVDATGRTHYFGSLQRREVFQPAKRVPFRQLDAPVPHDSDVYLTGHYGADYMTPPKEGSQERHVVFGFDLS